MDKMPEVVIESDTEEEIEPEIEPEPEPEPLPEKVQIDVDDVFKKSEILENAPTIKKPKRTRTMTPEALEKLAIARAKGLETRRRNKELRQKGEIPTPTQKKDEKKKQEMEAKRPVVNNVVHKTENITNNITHDDIIKITKKASQEALEEYEVKRKARKQAKKVKFEEENQKTIVKNKINSALGHKYGQEGFFDVCF
eukprot:COSAG01_NODE_4297_length_5164_cov_5.625469_2_plen_197_part_00